MKSKIIVVSIIIQAMFCMKIMAQKTQKLNNDVNVVLEEPIRQLNADGIKAFAKKNNIVYVDLFEDVKDGKTIYGIDGIIFTCIKFETAEKKDLDKMKKGIDGLARTVKSISNH